MSSLLFKMSANHSSCDLFVNISHATLHQKRIDLVHNLREGPRLRRRHTKSRSGCLTCKKRRIKCDEAVPACANCRKRGDHCVRPGVDSPRASSASPSSPPIIQRKPPRRRDISPQPAPRIEVLSLVDEHGLQGELIHHFVMHTATTLVFRSELWRGPLLRLSLQVDYLQNAILMIAATHRSVLDPSPEPTQNRYYRAARKYLGKTLRGYQDALSNSILSTPADALIAVSLLLYHYAWSSVDHAAVPFAFPNSPTVSRELTGGLNLAADPLLNLSVGLRYLFWKTGALATNSESPFHQYALERPRVKIVQAVRQQQQEQDILGQMESYLLRGYRSQNLSIAESSDTTALQLTADSLVDDTVALAAYSESAGRLAPILAVQSSSVDVRDDDISNDPDFSCGDHGAAVRLSDIIRYLFSYPIHFCDTFRSLVAAHDRRALFLLLHFFRAVRRLVPPDRCWWAQRRAMLLEHQLECILNEQLDFLEHNSLTGPISPRMDVDTEYALYPVRDWLDGECVHGQF